MRLRKTRRTRKAAPKIIQRVKAARPTTETAFKGLGLRLQKVNPSGLFRRTYRILGHDLVVKFPKGAEGRQHTRAEVRKIQRLSKWRCLADFLPKIHYCDSLNAIVVMDYYPDFQETNHVTREENIILAMGKCISRLITRITGIHVSDIHDENVHNKNGNAVIIDWGY